MEGKPKRVNKWASQENKQVVEGVSPNLYICPVLDAIKDNKQNDKKYFDEEQVKLIWENANANANNETSSSFYDGDHDHDHEKEYKFKPVEFDIDIDSDNDNESASNFSVDRFSILSCENENENENEIQMENEKENDIESENEEEGLMDWKQMYPVRKSLYNRKTHFISFLQNYTRYDMGRKMMSQYENTMCDFILEEMNPTSSEDFLKMLKECKLSNVYRFYDHIYKHKFKTFSYTEMDITTDQISKVVHMFNMFQAFFHRQEKFHRKNFLSMRFLIGRIFLYLGLVSDVDSLPVDLKRPKGRTQFLFHEQVWQMFLSSL